MSIKLTTLPNGFRIVTDTLREVETASLGIWIGAGSRHETIHNNGVAHFLEHMAFKGTTHRSAYEIVQSIEAVGGYLNAYTGREMTSYYARVLKNDVPLAIEILADILQNSLFDSAEILKEQDVILQELHQAQDTPDDIIFDYFQEAAFPSQSIGRSILGSAKNVKSMNRQHISQFMKTYYRPGQMVLSAAGNVDHDAIVQWVTEHFHYASDDRPLLQEAALYKGGHFREARELEQLHLVLGFQGVPSTHPDFYASSIYTTLLGGGMSSRLFQEVREKRGLVYSIYAFASSYHDTGAIGVYAGTGRKEVHELIQIITDELHKSTHTITEKELEQSKIQLKASSLMGLESLSYRARSMAQQVFVLGHPMTTQELIQSIDSVHLDQVHAFATTFLTSPLTLSAVGPIHNLRCFNDIQSSFKAL